MSKGGNQKVTQTVDPQTQAYVNQLRQSALSAQGNPIYAQGRQAGQLGLSALTGDAGALQQIMGGYSGLLDPYYNQLRQEGLSTIGDQATLAGAYGGGRQGVAEGSFLGQVAQGQAGQRYGEYQNALQRASGLAGMGLNIDPALQQMLAGSVGPYGTTQTTQTSSDPFSQILGLGSLALPFIFPPAAAAGIGAGVSGLHSQGYGWGGYQPPQFPSFGG